MSAEKNSSIARGRSHGPIRGQQVGMAASFSREVRYREGRTQRGDKLARGCRGFAALLLANWPGDSFGGVSGWVNETNFRPCSSAVYHFIGVVAGTDKRSAGH